jgi:hypothetical protein
VQDGALRAEVLAQGWSNGHSSHATEQRPVDGRLLLYHTVRRGDIGNDDDDHKGHQADEQERGLKSSQHGGILQQHGALAERKILPYTRVPRGGTKHYALTPAPEVTLENGRHGCGKKETPVLLPGHSSQSFCRTLTMVGRLTY